jgi:murein DD-endopeptidase MepM/ murein hydrolase activator NlpD
MNLAQYFKSKGQKLPSIAERAPIYRAAGYTDVYKGTAKQNILLLDYLLDKPIELPVLAVKPLVLSSPIRPKTYDADKGIIFLTQLFGENLMNYASLGLKGHNGIDYRTIHINQKGEAQIFAAHDGIIVSDHTVQSDTKGRFVNLMSDEVILEGESCKVQTVYFHLSKVLVPLGERVYKGQLIGIGGNTGQFTSGPHLHFGLVPYWKRGDGFIKNDNEYGGAIDPMPYFNDNCVLQRGGDVLGNIFYYNGVTIPRNYLSKVIYEAT